MKLQQELQIIGSTMDKKSDPVLYNFFQEKEQAQL